MLLVIPDLARNGAAAPVRLPSVRRQEAIGLASAIDLEIAATMIVPVQHARPATLIGKGKIAELSALASEHDADLVIFDHPLTPVQQRNLERELDAKVLDRTGLILEIFGRRAQTREGVIQVELAHLNYQKGRLVRSWTHLERQRGGAGFLGGPGETQIEADRRILQEKIDKLKKQLEKVRRTRRLHRQKRKKVPYPIVAIVGYTNAGKSTLFNRLTGAGVRAEDLLFATLDPTLRRMALPHGTHVLLSDTVGFISDLPTHLVAAFRATLEEVVEADVILHVRDISDPDSDAQRDDVHQILRDLDVDPEDQNRIIEVWNKIDLLDDERRLAIENRKSGKGAPKTVAISAVTGAGIPKLRSVIERLVLGQVEKLHIHIAPADHHLTGWLYDTAQVLARSDNDDGSVDLEVCSNHETIKAIRQRVTTQSSANDRNDDRSHVI